MKTIDLIYFNAGGGHRAAAQALRDVIHAQGRPWTVRCTHLVEVLDPQGAFRKLTGIEPEDVYNLRLARGWTIGLAQELKLLQRLIRLGHASMVRALQQHWLRTEPDLVVSLVPNFNRALCESVASSLPGVPFVTVMTDMADHPPNFWIEPDLPQHLVCGTPHALAQARAAGCDPARVHATSGMIVRPDFYQPAPIDRDAERLRLGLEPGRPTGLVLFGGQGSRAMLRIAEQLEDLPLILMCGHNEALAARLRRLPARAPRAIVGFTPEVRRHMQLADFFIGKPGPGSLSEAVQQGLPVITVRNAWTMPQERYNTQWVEETGAGIVHHSFRDIRPAVLSMTAQLDRYRAAVARIDNRAVFEVPEIFARLLDDSAGVGPPWPPAALRSSRVAAWLRPPRSSPAARAAARARRA